MSRVNGRRTVPVQLENGASSSVKASTGEIEREQKKQRQGHTEDGRKETKLDGDLESYRTVFYTV